MKYSGRVQRLPSSYADQQLHGDGIYYDLFFSEKAMSYARERWSSILQVQPILEKVETKFADPAKHRPWEDSDDISTLLFDEFDA